MKERVLVKSAWFTVTVWSVWQWHFTRGTSGAILFVGPLIIVLGGKP